jgi:uncharacterized protein (DUF1800 family)
VQARVADERDRAASRREFLRTITGQARAESAAPEDTIPGAPLGANVPPPVAWSDPRLRVVRRAGYGPRASDVDEVKRVGYQRWLNDQVNFERIDNASHETDVATRWPNLALGPAQLAALNAGTLSNELQMATLYRAAFSRRQLYERMVEFWTDHFSIDINKVGYLKLVDDRDVIRRHAMGKFGDLVRASAKSPAMLAYLDQNLSRNGAPNENYARELMELHTLGVDGGYTQQDVSELSRVLTGWTFTGAGVFSFNPSRHDWGAKTVLGVTIPAGSPALGQEGVKEGEQIIEFLLNHPSTARFIATKLLKWFVTPEPSEAQIAAIAGAYKATGGDIKRMVRATLNEGWIAQAPLKLKRPFHLVASGLRATDSVVANIDGMRGQVRTLGQPLFQWETPDGFPDLMEYWVGNILPRWSWANTLASSNSATTVRVNVDSYLTGTPDAALDRINAEYFAGELSPNTRAQLRTFLVGGTFNATRVRETISLALSCHEFQWY